MAIDKAVDSSALDASLTAVADAIRDKTGKTAAMTLAEMPTEIEGISGGGDTSAEDGIIDRTISGEYTNDRVTKVGIYAFYGCSALTSVSFPNATSIGNNAFVSCPRLAVANFPNAKSVGTSAFSFCNSLTTASFPMLTSIYGATFRECESLTTASFPAATSIVGFNAFYGCKTLTALVLRNTSTVCSLSNTNVFAGTPIESGTGYIYVPDALVDSYKAATNWSTYAAQIKPLSEYTGG